MVGEVIDAAAFLTDLHNSRKLSSFSVNCAFKNSLSRGSKWGSSFAKSEVSSSVDDLETLLRLPHTKSRNCTVRIESEFLWKIENL